MTQTTVGTRRYQSKALSFLLQTPRGRGYQPRTRRSKWMSNRQGSTLGIHSVYINGADLAATQLVVGKFVAIHGYQIGQDLTSKGCWGM